jgi:hypothetical protein
MPPAAKNLFESLRRPRTFLKKGSWNSKNFMKNGWLLEHRTFHFSGYAQQSATSQTHRAAKGRYFKHLSHPFADFKVSMGPLPHLTAKRKLFRIGTRGLSIK